MTPATILDFERRHPGHPAGKEERILAEFGVSAARYYQALIRAADKPEGMRADPVTARRVRDRAERVRGIG